MVGEVPTNVLPYVYSVVDFTGHMSQIFEVVCLLIYCTTYFTRAFLEQ